MEKTQHTREPWCKAPHDPDIIIGGDGQRVASSLCWKKLEPLRPAEEQEANTDRIVATLNACKDIPNEALDSNAVPRLVLFLDAYINLSETFIESEKHQIRTKQSRDWSLVEQLEINLKSARALMQEIKVNAHVTTIEGGS